MPHELLCLRNFCPWGWKKPTHQLPSLISYNLLLTWHPASLTVSNVSVPIENLQGEKQEAQNSRKLCCCWLVCPWSWSHCGQDKTSGQGLRYWDKGEDQGWHIIGDWHKYSTPTDKIYFWLILFLSSLTLSFFLPESSLTIGFVYRSIFINCNCYPNAQTFKLLVSADGFKQSLVSFLSHPYKFFGNVLLQKNISRTFILSLPQTGYQLFF